MTHDYSSPSRRTKAGCWLAMVMPTGKMRWFVVKGQTVKTPVAVGNIRASKNSDSRETDLYVVILATMLLMVYSMAAFRLLEVTQSTCLSIP